MQGISAFFATRFVHPLKLTKKGVIGQNVLVP